ncbi:hypothetical protein PDE_07301 [Penicillium oxalicum 114-2]|uniref:Uncharacterized protein n=1 Tax=Penicillium oxalicum (strain 114-2 / CGMCC 5302) TaxID=933388 RepID=S7ZUD4_PENO1|nr:hypothetical protein PDE_07301 [Penicillium oxalicum 114-2]
MAEVPVTQSNTVELPDSTRVVEQNRGSGDVGSSDSARRRNSGDQTERAPRIRTVVRTRRIYVRPCTADSKYTPFMLEVNSQGTSIPSENTNDPSTFPDSPVSGAQDSTSRPGQIHPPVNTAVGNRHNVST